MVVPRGARPLLATALATAVALIPAGSADARTGRASAAEHGWVGTWEAAASGTVDALPGYSIRNVVHADVGGPAVRVRVSNRLGTAPLTLGEVTVAVQQTGSPKSPEAVAGTMREVTFRHAGSVTVPAGADAVSDPVPLRVPTGGNLLVTLYTPTASGPATFHHSALQTSFLASGGDHAAEPAGTAYTTSTGYWYYLTGVDVFRPQVRGDVVALGDSITDGSGSTSNANRRWPDDLAARLNALPPSRRFGMLNAGIAGNRLLLDDTGPNALSRLDEDVFSRSGVRALIVLEGINDIKNDPPQTDPARIEDAYRRIVHRAHAHGIRVIGGTITPFGGHGGYTDELEAVRQAVNAFVRTSGLFDGVADFDAAVRDPADPHQVLLAYDHGDHLHMNDAGYRAMADAVDLADLGGRP
ncbi:SGNH/GDSL hydrolase family protein [Actinoallomurus sp. CA-150999]|uniref:SGNH/GDSL hydrolase family protein n=1 Tax=Actinoallomurus sp. CA-150999 TaxID=3239887 RepID=UPI003D9007AA